MFDINFHLFHDENYSDYITTDQQPVTPVSPNETHQQQLRPGKGESGIAHRAMGSNKRYKYCSQCFRQSGRAFF